MVFYLTECLLTESVSGQEVAKAIGNRQGVLITYTGENDEHTGVRYIEPYVYGLTLKGNPCIRAYQYYGDTKRGVPAWKLLRLDRIQSWEPTDNTFDLEPQARGWAAQAFHGQDKSMQQVFKVVELGEEPKTDLEKLQAKTRQLKASKPVNINQVQQQQKPAQQSPVKPEATVSGPVGNPQPQDKVQNPIKPEQTPNQTNKADITQNAQQPPTETQTVSTSGPITGDATNPDVNKPDELMSNDQFRDMLRRNLERTDKEKQKRGFNLGNSGNQLNINK